MKNNKSKQEKALKTKQNSKQTIRNIQDKSNKTHKQINLILRKIVFSLDLNVVSIVEIFALLAIFSTFEQHRSKSWLHCL